MAEAAASIPIAPSAADELLDPAVTPWRPELPERDEGVPMADEGPSPVSYSPPRLLPVQPNVDASEAPREALIPLQRWEGVVLDVEDTSFVVRLVDTAGENADEEVTLPKGELCEFDLELLEPGAILYWTIGYRRTVRGVRERVSRIRLRRLPAWTESQLRDAKERASVLARELDW